MNKKYLEAALNFHGPPLQKIWEEERGAGDLQKLGVPQQLSYSLYHERQKNFTFQDRAKRLKLHQLLTRKANKLYDAEILGPIGTIRDETDFEKIKPFVASVPPYERFIDKEKVVDKFKRTRCVLEGIKRGDIVYGKVSKPFLSTVPMAITALCTAEPLVRYLADMPTKAFSVHPSNIGAQELDKRGNPRHFAVNDYVCCEVLEVSVDADRLILGMEGVITKNKSVKLGLVSLEDLPMYYRKSIYPSGNYEECLRKSKEFFNPNYDVLFSMNGLRPNETFSFMSSLTQEFPADEYATGLRENQATRLAFRAVADGIEFFKNGHHIEAFQSLNRALHYDPHNVEGLVARGALYANKGSFHQAIADFKKALDKNPNHANARKYISETLVALARSYEEENRFDDAIKAYRNCLEIIPNHEQARSSLALIQLRFNPNGFNNYTTPGPNTVTEPSIIPANTNNYNINEASYSGDSSGSDTESDNQNQKKEPSLSPLSKQLALHSASLKASGNFTGQPFNQQYYMGGFQNPESFLLAKPNEFKLDDDDTESRVRKLIQDASKHKKEKHKSVKKKKSKKSKKDTHKEKTDAFLEKIGAFKGLKHEFDIGNNFPNSSDSNFLNISNTPAKTPIQMPPYASHNYSRTDKPDDSKNVAGKFSFQIKKPVKIDKFGLVRIATPLMQKSPTCSPPRCSVSKTRRHSKSISRSRSRQRDETSRRRRSRSLESGSYRKRSSRYSRSRSRSNEYNRRRKRYSRSRTPKRSRSRSLQRRRHNNDRSSAGHYGRRRTPSPFNARQTSPRRRRYSRSPNRTRSPVAASTRPKYGNRIWQRSGYHSSTTKPSSDERWLHDKFDEQSIEEIEEIINKAQIERKKEIINRDKDILKKRVDL